MVTLGNFFFRFRNALFPVVICLLLAITRPDIPSNPSLAPFWILTGAILAISGEIIRLLTIGLRYIERGGREGRVYASRIVKEGIYAHTRNPMYLGNAMIAIGLLIYSGSLVAFLAGAFFFALAYTSIIKAEEAYLKRTFGEEYAEYCRTVNSFFPSLHGLGTTILSTTFDWRRSLRKDYGNVAFVVAALILLPLWRHGMAGDTDWVRAAIPATAVGSAILGALYLSVRILKKTHRLGAG